MKEAVTDIEHLRKLFIMPDSPDKFMEFGHELLKLIHDFFQEKGGIHSSIELPELSRIFSNTSMPEKPMLIKDVLKEIEENIIKHSVKVGSPYYIGHMISAIPYFMILLEMIIAALNQNQVKIETAKASSFVERELIAWLHRLVFRRKEQFYKKNIQNPKVALGNVTSDGTIANLTALLVAREKAFPPDKNFPGVRVVGMEKALKYYGYSRGVIIVSARGHYSIKKAANILGIGEENVILIPVDENHKIDIKKLIRKVKNLRKKKVKIISIIGIAGTTETGNIDDLLALSEIAEEVGTHFHVDACWGGAALVVDEYRPLFRGIERADSVTIDAHKLLYCPMTMGIVLFRNEKDLNYIKYTSQYIIRKNSVDIGRFTVEGSRPFSSLKPWAALKIIGKNGYRLLFKHAQSSTDKLKEILENCGNFEVLNSPELFILIYRFIPQEVQCELKRLFELSRSRKIKKEERKRFEDKVKKINCLINALNVKLHKELRKDDTTFVSRTRLESTKYRPQNIVVLRAVPINPLITEEILKEIVAVQNRIGMKLWEEFKPAYLRLLEKN